ncbi:MAG: hypothetical protein Q4C49_00775 [Bacillota bacterium]|nr:hypothetical protein [Bacillota bacterium]
MKHTTLYNPNALVGALKDRADLGYQEFLSSKASALEKACVTVFFSDSEIVSVETEINVDGNCVDFLVHCIDPKQDFYGEANGDPHFFNSSYYPDDESYLDMQNRFFAKQKFCKSTRKGCLNINVFYKSTTPSNTYDKLRYEKLAGTYSQLPNTPQILDAIQEVKTNHGFVNCNLVPPENEVVVIRHTGDRSVDNKLDKMLSNPQFNIIVK